MKMESGMRFIYFDPFNGASGDMILGGLLDLGLPLEFLISELRKLQLEQFDMTAQRIERRGMTGVNLQVKPAGEEAIRPSAGNRHGAGGPSHDGAHAHQADGDTPRHRHLKEIRRLIETSGLDPWVRDCSLRIFQRLGEAEAKVHQTPLESIHFHEVGAVDSIVDVVGACLGFKYLEVEEFYSAPLNLGSGTVKFSHGEWPVPAPATAELVRGFPTYLGAVHGELTTPTGAAIITTLVDPQFRPAPGRIERSGFGAGDREFPDIPNMLRLILARRGEKESFQSAPSQETVLSGTPREEVVLLETNIDDLDAEAFAHVLELAIRRGALDAYCTPVHMKKGRPGMLLSVLCRPADEQRLAELLFRETTTLGIRRQRSDRWALEREVRTLETEFGPIRIKIGRLGGRVVNLAPEFDDLKSASERNKVPLKILRQKVMEQVASEYD